MADNNNKKKEESTEEERMMAKAVKLWSILKEQVFAPPYCTAIEQLVTRVQYVWNNISKETLTGLVHKTSSNWTKRVSDVIDNQGENNF